MAPQSRLADFYQTSLSECCQMAGDPRLRNAEDLYQVAYAHFTALQQVQNSQPGWIRKSTQQLLDRPGYGGCGGGFHGTDSNR